MDNNRKDINRKRITREQLVERENRPLVSRSSKPAEQVTRSSVTTKHVEKEDHRRRRRNGYSAPGTFFGSEFVLDGGLRDSYNRPIDISREAYDGYTLPTGEYIMPSRTGFITPVSQALGSVGAVPIRPVVAPLINRVNVTPYMQTVDTLTGLPTYSPATAVNINNQIPLIYSDNPNVHPFYQSTGYIPTQNLISGIVPVNYTNVPTLPGSYW